ncbi:MAG: hypothetical protein LUE11_06905 [Clostridia bacterium]|nr:hypothetical protein [Clostridia bacterium]
MPLATMFGEGKYSITIRQDIIDSVAEDIVYDVWEKMPSNARTPEIIKCVIKRAEELADSMLVTYVSHTNLEEHMK